MIVGADDYIRPRAEVVFGPYKSEWRGFNELRIYR